MVTLGKRLLYEPVLFLAVVVAVSALFLPPAVAAAVAVVAGVFTRTKTYSKKYVENPTEYERL